MTNEQTNENYIPNEHTREHSSATAPIKVYKGEREQTL